MGATLATNLGRIGGKVAEAVGYLTSPVAIEGEIRSYTAAIAAGDTSPTTAALLADWRAIKAAQARLVGEVAGDGA